jgi:hypothetical protein
MHLDGLDGHEQRLGAPFACGERVGAAEMVPRDPTLISRL